MAKVVKVNKKKSKPPADFKSQMVNNTMSQWTPPTKGSKGMKSQNC